MKSLEKKAVLHKSEEVEEASGPVFACHQNGSLDECHSTSAMSSNSKTFY